LQRALEIEPRNDTVLRQIEALESRRGQVLAG
jgi:hypothetical protein